MSRARLPTVVSKIPNDLRMFLDRVREALGNGDLVFKQDLFRGGIAAPGGPGGDLLLPPDEVLITPPAPTGLRAYGGLATIILEWDYPNYAGHSHTDVWRADEDDFGQAVLIGQAPGSLYSDAIGSSATAYYWVRFVSITDTAGPYNGTAGTLGETGHDPVYLLELLEGQITGSQLHADLGERIESIGDLGQAIEVEAQTREEETGELFAKYTVKIDQHGYVSGFGLASTANGDAPTSEFAVRADSFYIASPSGPEVPPALPFIVRTTPTMINGVSVPVGVYIADAFIANGTITNAKIGLAAIDDAKISNVSAVKVTFGEMEGARIKVDSLNADRITTNTFLAKLAHIDEAYITKAHIIDAEITTAKIQDAAIINAKIANAAITEAKIGNAAITTAKIASAAITEAKIVNAAVTNAKIANAAIDEAKIANAAITEAKIANAAIDTAKIREAAIDTLRVAGNAVTTAVMIGDEYPRSVWFDVPNDTQIVLIHDGKASGTIGIQTPSGFPNPPTPPASTIANVTDVNVNLLGEAVSNTGVFLSSVSEPQGDAGTQNYTFKYFSIPGMTIVNVAAGRYYVYHPGGATACLILMR